MKKYKLTFDPVEIREIYRLSATKKELKSFDLYLLLLGAIISLASTIYVILIDGIDDKVLMVVISLISCVYLSDLFLKRKKSLKRRISWVEDFIQKNEKYTLSTISIDNSHLVLEQDGDYTKCNLKEVKTLKIEDNYLWLDQNKATLLLPKGAFEQNEWQEFIEKVKQT